MKKILVVAAHPDDEILGCGGTIARLTREGYEAYTLILGEGITSRGNAASNNSKIKILKKQAKQANKIIGVKDIFLYDFPDNRFDSVPLLDIVKVIEKIKRLINPEIVFTHYNSDLNIDHKTTYEAVLTAFRPVPGSKIEELYSFEIPSSTEWNYPNYFSPNVFVNIDKTIKMKANALKCYVQEVKKFPHPRSIEAIECIAKRWGSTIGIHYAEAFEAVRVIRK